MKLEYSCVINVVTDLASKLSVTSHPKATLSPDAAMALPLWQLKELHVKLRQKIALAFVFSVALICVILDIVRTVEAIHSNQALYTVLEINFVVIVSCFPTYRALLSLGQQERSRKPSQYSSGSRPSVFSSWRRPSVFSSWKKMENAAWSNGQGRSGSRPDANDVENGIEMNPHVIRTSKGFVVSEELRDPFSTPSDLNVSPERSHSPFRPIHV